MKPNADYERDGLFIRQGDCYRKCFFSRIAWLEASGSYCCIHFCDTTRIMVSHPLGHVEGTLPAEHFLRIHRSYVVNLNYVETLIGNLVGLGGSLLLPVSSTYRKQLYSRFHILGTADAVG